MIFKFSTNMLLRTVDWGNGKYWVVICYIYNKKNTIECVVQLISPYMILIYYSRTLGYVLALRMGLLMMREFEWQLLIKSFSMAMGSRRLI